MRNQITIRFVSFFGLFCLLWLDGASSQAQAALNLRGLSNNVRMLVIRKLYQRAKYDPRVLDFRSQVQVASLNKRKACSRADRIFGQGKCDFDPTRQCDGGPERGGGLCYSQRTAGLTFLQLADFLGQHLASPGGKSMNIRIPCQPPQTAPVGKSYSELQNEDTVDTTAYNEANGAFAAEAAFNEVIRQIGKASATDLLQELPQPGLLEEDGLDEGRSEGVI